MCVASASDLRCALLLCEARRRQAVCLDLSDEAVEVVITLHDVTGRGLE